MTEKMRMTAIWISPDTYQKLLYVERVLITKNGRSTNPSDVVEELVEFWKKHRP
jgi:predicted CopG family antitoxin